MSDSTDSPESAGVWMACYSDGSSVAPFPDELSALRHVVERHMNDAVFVAWGVDFATAMMEKQR